jgi:hypothetical protein
MTIKSRHGESPITQILNTQMPTKQMPTKQMPTRQISMLTILEKPISQIQKNITPYNPPVSLTSKTSDKTTMQWGEPTWFLLHTIAEKISESNFSNQRLDILNTIFAICTNLPCPVCSDHALIFLNKMNFLRIKTRKDLREFLFYFHNNVNNRKGYPEFPRSEFETKYAAADYTIVLRNFINNFNKNSSAGKYFAAELFRARLGLRLRDWLYKNKALFE